MDWLKCFFLPFKKLFGYSALTTSFRGFKGILDKNKDNFNNYSVFWNSTGIDQSFSGVLQN